MKKDYLYSLYNNSHNLVCLGEQIKFGCNRSTGLMFKSVDRHTDRHTDDGSTGILSAHNTPNEPSAQVS